MLKITFPLQMFICRAAKPTHTMFKMYLFFLRLPCYILFSKCINLEIQSGVYVDIKKKCENDTFGITTPNKQKMILNKNQFMPTDDYFIGLHNIYTSYRLYWNLS